MNRELGLSIKYPCENVFSSGKFSCIEYSAGASFKRGGAFAVWHKNTAKVKELCRKYNVRMRSYHIPFNGERLGGPYMFAPTSLDPALREATLERTEYLIDGLLDMGLEYVVIHGSLRVPPEQRTQRVELFVEYLKKLCDYCKPFGITVAVETLLESCIGGGGTDPENRIREFRYIMENVERDNIGICLDNNHFLLSDPIKFVRELGQYVVTTHFSDYYGKDEEHLLPGCGITDWKTLTALLIEKGYSGPWVFEIGFEQSGIPSDRELEMLTENWNKIIKAGI